MVKDAPLSFRVEADLKAALEKAAKDDRRSVSSMTEKILEEWLKAKGYIPK